MLYIGNVYVDIHLDKITSDAMTRVCKGTRLRRHTGIVLVSRGPLVRVSVSIACVWHARIRTDEKTPQPKEPARGPGRCFALHRGPQIHAQYM